MNNDLLRWIFKLQAIDETLFWKISIGYMKNVGIADDHNQGGVYLDQAYNALHFYPYVISLQFCKIFHFSWAVYTHAECNPILILETTRVDLLIKQEPFSIPLSVYNSVPQKRTWLQSSVEITCFSPIPAFEEDQILLLNGETWKTWTQNTCWVKDQRFILQT